MISRLEILKNSNTSTNNYVSQKSDERGQKNLFVGGNANDTVINDTDETVILSGAGSDLVLSNGNKNKIESNSGDSQIVSTGNQNSIHTSNGNTKINVTGNNNNVETVNGDNILLTIGSGNNINTGIGNDQILALGDYTNINDKAGNNSIVFEGNNINITTGEGNDYIASLDFAIAGGAYTDFAKYLDGKSITETTKNVLISSEYQTKELSRNTDITSTTSADDVIKQLPAKEQEMLKNINMNEQVNGLPKYVIARASRDGKLHLYQNRGGSYTAMGSVSTNGDYVLNIDKNGLTQLQGEKTTTTTVTVVTQDIVINKYADVTKTTLKGNKNVNINDKGGNNTLRVNGENMNVEVGNGNNEMTLVNGIIVNTDYSNHRTEELQQGEAKTTETKDIKKEFTTSATVAGGNSYTYDPLVIDFNQDGKISAEAGKGVDIDGNGIADGAAVGGDKMLAISDINGNGKIDGAEVFGDKTVNPFTGENFNAANGFEALKMMAEAAETNTGIDCIDEKGLVNLKALNDALQSKGIKLGFVSEDTKGVEDLSKVAYINTSNYSQGLKTGSVQENQVGTSIFEDGSEARVADIWFESQIANNPFDISKLKELLK